MQFFALDARFHSAIPAGHFFTVLAVEGMENGPKSTCCIVIFTIVKCMHKKFVSKVVEDKTIAVFPNM